MLEERRIVRVLGGAFKLTEERNIEIIPLSTTVLGFGFSPMTRYSL